MGVTVHAAWNTLKIGYFCNESESTVVMNFHLTFAQVSVVAKEIDWTWTWLTVFGLMVGLVTLSYSTRIGVIARATTKEAIRQPLFILLVLISAAILVVNSVMPFFTLEDDAQ